jgi:hypothetical protein
MMVRVAIALGLASLLAACGGGGSSGTQSVTVTGADGNKVTATSTELGSAATQNCASRPDFAPLYPGAKIEICNAAHMEATGKDAGSIIYKTDATPEAVLAFVKAETAKAGLKPGMDMATMYSAVDGTKRTTMTHAEPDPAGGTKVVLNWGKTP